MNAINTLRISSEDTGQILRIGDRTSESRRTSTDDGLRVDPRGILWDKGLEAVGEDCASEAQKQRTPKCLAKHEECHRDGDLRRKETILDGDYWLAYP